MDSYLEIARKVLREAGQPLSARQILQAAYKINVVPRDLYGRTQHKTLHARISTDILKLRSASEFYRTAPGRFFLRYLLNDRTIPARYRREYMAPLRATQLGRFDVVALPRAELAGMVSRSPSKVSVNDLMSLTWRYARMSDLWRSVRLLPFRLFIVVVNDDRILLSHRVGTAADDFPQRTTLGVTGVVRREDRSLFSPDRAGLSDAAVRTLIQSLHLPRTLISAIEEGSRWSAPVALYDQGAVLKSDDLVAAIAFRCSGIPGFVEAIDSLTTSEWLSLPILVNDIEQFDRWSAKLIGDTLLQSTVLS